MMDKENLQSPSKMDDMSMYENNSPRIAPICSSPSHCTHNIIRRPLEDHDSNSQDSGYSASFQSDHVTKYMSYTSPSRGSFQSFGSNSMGSMEDEFLEDFSDVEPLEKHGNLPEDFEKLLDGPLITKPKLCETQTEFCARPPLRRSFSHQPSTRDTPNSRRIRSCLFKTDDVRPFKRPDPPSTVQVVVKKSKIFEDDEDEASVPEVPFRPQLKRAFSATEESIMSAVQRSADTDDLIGDFSKSFCLPLTNGRHRDLKAITPHTLAALMRGEFDHSIASFKIIDCRYPYEFDGGHINGAINIYTKDKCLELLNENTVAQQQHNKRHILVFHCEFSSERGPNLYRYLRKEDRHRNEQEYPSLNYPEIYLLEGGYKNFFQYYSEMCIPIAYKEMLHPEHEHDLRHFRQKSKTWNMDSRPRPQLNRRRFGRLDV
ncbi:M-phase inducer phosphatase-like isoform X2 [Aethina tumida]|nr:M-phase inducer phosphatase-like isoform X2 [Aethina tumida]